VKISAVKNRALKSSPADVRIWICGVRGSTSAPGAEFAGVGGHTSCVALAHDGEMPCLVLDAGTGLRRLTTVLGDAAFRGTLLLGHLHWDHTEGLPFFGAGDRDDALVRVLLPEQGRAAIDLLGKSMSPPNFPITPDQLHGEWTFGTVDEGPHRLEGFEVLAREIPHKGGRTFGYRITDGRGRSLAYLSDHAPQELGSGESGLGELHPAAVELAAGVDLLVHDAQYTVAEFATRSLYGHSAAPYAAMLAERAGAKRVLLYHHEPNRTDEQVAAIVRSVASEHPSIDVACATEGAVIDL
jgi:ribonuclease BN (tRNA processing enzyme)